MKLRVLVGCEFSGTVRRAFRALGHDAWSCDLLPSDDDSPHHIQGNVLPLAYDDWDNWEPPSRGDRWERSDPWDDRPRRPERFREEPPRERASRWPREDDDPWGPA